MRLILDLLAMHIPLLKLLLASLNMAILCFLMALLFSQCRGQNDLRSWGNTFHVLALLWLMLRGTFWAMTITDDGINGAALFYILYWLPNPLQFASFLLLPLFYGQVLSSKKKWTMHWSFIRPIYIILTSGMVVFMITTAIVTAVQEHIEYHCMSLKPYGQCYHPLYHADAFRVLVAFCFFGLAVVVAICGAQMAKLEDSRHRRFLIYKPQYLVPLNCTLFLVFLSKSFYQLLSIFSVWYLPNIPLQGDQDISFLNFSAFCLWDYTPTVLLLLVITDSCQHARVKNTSGVNGPRLPISTLYAKNLPHLLPNYGLFREIKIEAMRSNLGHKSNFDQLAGSSSDSLVLSDWYASREILGKAGFDVGEDVLGPLHYGSTDVNSAVEGCLDSWRYGQGCVFDDPNRYWENNNIANQQFVPLRIPEYPGQFPYTDRIETDFPNFDGGNRNTDLRRASNLSTIEECSSPPKLRTQENSPCLDSY